MIGTRDFSVIFWQFLTIYNYFKTESLKSTEVGRECHKTDIIPALKCLCSLGSSIALTDGLDTMDK